MYSGGQEGVLVVWKFGGMEQRFMPRLGSPISFITCSEDDKFLAVSLTNNSVLLISCTSWSIVSLIQGLKSGMWLKQVL
jgi:hypothetical protein